MGGRQEEGRKGSETAEGVMNENERIQETATPPPASHTCSLRISEGGAFDSNNSSCKWPSLEICPKSLNSYGSGSCFGTVISVSQRKDILGFSPCQK